MDIMIKVHEGGFAPAAATDGSAGCDIRLPTDVLLLPNSCQLVGARVSIWVQDPKVCILVLPRSGLGHKEGLVLGNLVGLIDSDYQGELMLSLWNRSEHVRQYKRGQKVAQVVCVPVIQPTFTVVQDFGALTDRGVGGFNSTGS